SVDPNTRKPHRSFQRALVAGVIAALAAACSSSDELRSAVSSAEVEDVGSATAALAIDDGLADAYVLFKNQFVNRLGFDQNYPIGYGYHPGLSREKLVTAGHTPRGQAKITFAQRDGQGAILSNGLITASLEDVPAGQKFDLWFVKNVPGSGRTVAPEK